MGKACVCSQSHGAPGLCVGAPGLGAYKPSTLDGVTLCMNDLPEQGPLLNTFQCPLPPPAQSLMPQPATWHMVHAQVCLSTSPQLPAPLSSGGTSVVQAARTMSPEACKAKLLKIPSVPQSGDNLSLLPLIYNISSCSVGFLGHRWSLWDHKHGFLG